MPGIDQQDRVPNSTHRAFQVRFAHPEPQVHEVHEGQEGRAGDASDSDSGSGRNGSAREPGRAIFPIFLPFAACPQRCCYCAQDIQTGQAPAPLTDILERAGRALAHRLAGKAGTVELAFYGGTFTALPQEDQDRCMAFSALWRERGAISAVRCSTRPDAVSLQGLEDLRAAGLHLVELGVQSFHDAALTATRRGYTGASATEACCMVKAAGLKLGVQLMPGMPGLSPEESVEDARRAAELRPSCARLYPCLVLEGSALAKEWRAGRYRPWQEQETLETLAECCRILWRAKAPVIRMGLAPEADLLRNTLAGPFHPALGSRVRALALLRDISDRIGGPDPRFLRGPKRYQGEFWGHRKELLPRYAALGIAPERVSWEERPDFIISKNAVEAWIP